MEPGETICTHCHTIILSSPLRKEEKFFCSNSCWRKFNEEEKKIMRKCPACAEFVKWEAKKCKHCGEFLPESAIPGDVKRILEERESRAKNASTSSSIMSFIAILFFLIFIVAMFYFYSLN